VDTDSPDITGLLKAWSEGDVHALSNLAPLIDAELRRLARNYLRREPQERILQTTALINEAYLRLIPARGLPWMDREHFFAVSAQIMRRILVDVARARQTEKRGGMVEHVSLESDNGLFPGTTDGQILALNDALEVLARLDARKSKVIELRYFGGLSVEETAVALQVSPQTVMRDWKLAKSWLARELRATT